MVQRTRTELSVENAANVATSFGGILSVMTAIPKLQRAKLTRVLFQYDRDA
jgi:hypothetical protein